MRYIVVKGLGEKLGGSPSPGNRTPFYVVDTEFNVVIADCGDSEGTAKSVANAMNAMVTE